MLNADEVREEGHELKGFGELAVAHRLAILDVRLQLENLLTRDFEHPASRTIVLRPGLRTGVRSVAQLDVFQMKVDAREPLVNQLRDASIRRRHVGSGSGARIMHRSGQESRGGRIGRSLTRRPALASCEPALMGGPVGTIIEDPLPAILCASLSLNRALRWPTLAVQTFRSRQFCRTVLIGLCERNLSAIGRSRWRSQRDASLKMALPEG